jgi:lipopolysaccharide export system protein LptA
VWTPKRVLLLAAGFVVFLTAYLVYAHFLGGIDGLPPLPEAYSPIASDGGGPPETPPPPQENSANSKLRLAFANSWDEIKYRKIKLELQQRGIVLAAQDATIQPDGTVKLEPFSLAVFRKQRAGEEVPEINTVQCKTAILRFDRPVTKIYEISGRRVTGAELHDDISIINNRRSRRVDDDICLVTQSLIYDEAQHHIYTDREVRVTDPQSKSRPVTITGVGLDLYLTNDPKPGSSNQSNPHKSKSDTPSGVERIRLRHDVEMNLWVDAHSGFLMAGKTGGDKPPSQMPSADDAAKPPAQDEKAKVQIITRGPFTYDMRTDHAIFEMLYDNSPRPNYVTVDRVRESDGKVDHLQCDQLDLQFHRNAAGTPPPENSPGETRSDGLDIEVARATGKEVILQSDAEVLEAHGTDFTYDKRTHVSTLRGEPRVYVIKEGTEIKAAELQLLDLKGAQQAIALGEGEIDMFDKEKATRPLQASWKKKLIYTKEANQDILILQGDATFRDKEHGQQIQAETLKVWLEPADAAPSRSGEQQRRRPHHLDAVEHVRVDGPEMRLRDTEHLIIRFHDAPLAGSQLPPVPTIGPRNEDPYASARSADGTQELLPNVKNNLPATPAGNGPQANEPGKAKKPIDLSAVKVEADVLRSGNKNDLEKLWCEGTVHVHQDPQTPAEKGIDIHGETLELKHHLNGNEIEVTGDNTNHAAVQLNQVYILGPVVNLDQTANRVWVNGPGNMRLPNKANLDGTPSQRETELTIYWCQHMDFDGQRAEFDPPRGLLPEGQKAPSGGGVRADQDNSHMACTTLQVYLDRKVSLREGDRGAPPAKVQQLICEGNVWVEDSTYRDGRLVAHRSMRGVELSLDNDADKSDSIVQVEGPGWVRIFQLGDRGEVVPGLQPGGGNNIAPAKARSKTGKTEEEFKLTQVTFQGKMIANNKQGIATFFQDVVVVHVLTENKDLPINEIKPPEGSIRLSCAQLQVLGHKLKDGTTQTEMNAKGKVLIQGDNFSGEADEAKYDEAKDQLILVGSPTNQALLVKRDGKGTRPQSFRGVRIFYHPKDGTFQVEEASRLDFGR